MTHKEIFEALLAGKELVELQKNLTRNIYLSGSGNVVEVNTHHDVCIDNISSEYEIYSAAKFVKLLGGD